MWEWLEIDSLSDGYKRKRMEHLIWIDFKELEPTEIQTKNPGGGVPHIEPKIGDKKRRDFQIPICLTV